MTQLSMDFEVDRLVKKSGGRLKRGSEVRRRGQLPPTDPQVSTVEAVVRFARQNDVILERLQKGPAENYELAALAINYRARISDLRQHGFTIKLERKGGGRNIYHLTENPRA